MYHVISPSSCASPYHMYHVSNVYMNCTICFIVNEVVAILIDDLIRNSSAPCQRHRQWNLDFVTDWDRRSQITLFGTDFVIISWTKDNHIWD